MDHPTYRLFSRELVSVLRSFVPESDNTTTPPHQNGLMGLIQQLGLATQLFLVLLDRIDIYKENDCPIDLVLQRLVRPNAQRVPAPCLVLNILLFNADGVDGFHEQVIKIRYGKIELDIRDGPPDVRRNEVQYFFGGWREAPDTQIGSEHHDSHLHTAEKIDEIVIGQTQFKVAMLQFLI